jgi:uncharacterized protein YndB with AHSA1/START domain
MRGKTIVSGGLVLKETSIRATPRRVFAALTRPAQLNIWFTTEARVDLRVGGRYSNRDKDRGTYLEIVPNRRLRFTWDNPGHAAGSIVEIILTRKNGTTTVTLLHYEFRKRKDFEHYSSKTSGWDWALDNLKAHCESRPGVQYEDWLRNHSD